MTVLPVEAALPELRAALSAHASAVLVAPPGAGKSTRVPLALLDEGWRGDGRILVLEPRRLAARAAARRMAETLGEPVGRTVGYRVRMDAKVSAATRVEVVTSGVFVRMIADDPELAGVAAVLFDEVHERALDTDLGLALALDSQAALRPDLKILAMSATADAARIAALLGGAPVVTSTGRSFPVETRHAPPAPRTRMEDAVAEAVRRALRDETGSVLAFLPGRAEIERTAERLADGLPPNVDVVPLHGGLDGRAQDAAIRPAESGRRKVVLATPIAETSITIEGVRVVVDAGYVRRPRFEPAMGLTRLVTEKVSRAAADQRRGRAGRTEPGVCVRLWAEAQTAALLPFDPPEILDADLASLALDLAEWGVDDPRKLAWLDPPPEAAFREARALLEGLGAIDAAGSITADGRALRALPLPPRLAHMVHKAAETGEAGLAAEIALVLTEQGLGGRDVNVAHRLDALARDRSERARAGRDAARRWAQMAGGKGGTGGIDPLRVGRLLALAFPDRIAQARGQAGAYRTAAGRGGLIDPAIALAREPFLAVAELQGAAQNARILLAAPLDLATIEENFAGRIVEEEVSAFDPEVEGVRTTRVRRLGALVLAERRTVPKPDAKALSALLDGIAGLGLDRLPWSAETRQLRARAGFLHRTLGAPWPDVSDAALLPTLADWLGPYVPGAVGLSDISRSALAAALDGFLAGAGRPGDLDRLAPSRLATPSGRSAEIDYAGDRPTVSVRVQDLYGLATHPTVAGGALPLVVHLLSPADRPIQVTTDLPGFWRGSWSDVRSDLRGRYPKHAWPEDPATAPPVRLNKHLRTGDTG